jgi:uncharacterized protein (TIGR03083 family)
VDYSDYIAALRWNAAAAARAARDLPADTIVPSCPEWTLGDLVRHLGSHHRWVAGNLDCPPDGEMFQEFAHSPEGAAPDQWLRDGAETLAAKLEATDPSTPCWTWVPFDRTAGFWARRTAQETAMHRWDAQHAAGAEDAINGELAVDAIDEYLAFVPYFPGRTLPDSGAIHLHSTDAEGEWLVRLDGGRMHVTREHAKGDVAVRGPASDLLLVVYGRKPADEIDAFGDASLFEQFRDQAKF